MVANGAIREAIDRIESEHSFVEWSPIPQSKEEFDDGNLDKDDGIPFSKYNNFKYYICKTIHLDQPIVFKIKLIKNDIQKIQHGRLLLDIRNYYGIYEYILQGSRNKKKSFDHLLKQIEFACFNIEVEIFDSSYDDRFNYVSSHIFEYTPKIPFKSTLTDIEISMIQEIQRYSINKNIYLTDLTKHLSKTLNITRNKVIRTLYKWKVFEKKDFSQDNCTSNLEINRNQLTYVLSLISM